MLAVIDYGAGNLRSVVHALKHLNVTDMQVVRRPEQLAGAEKIILPGVGAFGSCMAQMHKQELVAPLKDALAAGIPYLGICVGMQMLFDVGEEMGEHAGLGILRRTRDSLPPLWRSQGAAHGLESIELPAGIGAISGLGRGELRLFCPQLLLRADRPECGGGVGGLWH